MADLSWQGWVIEDRRYAVLIERLAAEGRPLDDLLLGGIVDGTAVANQFPAGLRKVVIEDAGHFLQLEQPERVAEQVIGFLKSGL